MPMNRIDGGDFGHLNDFGVQTPRLDALAEQGVRFTKSYNTTAICQASRASYMTGLYEFTTGTNFAHGGIGVFCAFLYWELVENSDGWLIPNWLGMIIVVNVIPILTRLLG